MNQQQDSKKSIATKGCVRVLPVLALTLLSVSSCSPALEALGQSKAAVSPTSDAILNPGLNDPTAPHDEPVAETAIPPNDRSDDIQVYSSNAFGLQFDYPASWYGPDVVEWEGGLRVEVGSDVVYPYGTGRDERTYERTNSYFVVVQLNQNRSSLSLEELRQDQPWLETYFTLLELADGESVAGARELITRVRQVEVEGFTGIEYIATLSETAQTERFYAREAILLDEHFNVLRVTGSPNNVDVPNPAAWREAYRQVDQDHAAIFDSLLRSIAFE